MDGGRRSQRGTHPEMLAFLGTPMSKISSLSSGTSSFNIPWNRGLSTNRSSQTQTPRTNANVVMQWENRPSWNQRVYYRHRRKSAKYGGSSARPHPGHSESCPCVPSATASSSSFEPSQSQSAKQMPIQDPAALAEESQSAAKEDETQAKYRKWKLRIFYSIFMGYATFYFTRSSFVYSAPGMRAALGFSLEQLGIITSIFPVAYGISKLVAGILSDSFSTRVFMAVGLAATGVINIIFGMQTSLVSFCVLWALNGIFQGFGAPPCAKLLTTWYPKSERGTWWGFWNTSHNTGGFLIPFLSGYAVRNFGWNYGMILPGVIAIVMGLFLFNRIRDSPEAVGLPADIAEEENLDEKEKIVTDAASNGAKPKLSMKETLFKYVLTNPYVWLLAVSYFFVYFVRQGISSWAYIYLLDFKGVPNPQDAAFRMSGMEIGGLLGSLSSGYTSDKMMKGRRIPVIVGWMVGLIISIIGLWYVPVNWRIANWLVIFAIGFFIYGPQMLVGLAGAELVDKSAVSSTIGLLGWIAYLGASVAGFPLTKIVTSYGWQAYIMALVGFSAVAIALLLPMWNLGVKVDKKAIRLAELEGRQIPCGQCGGDGTVMKLECGPATPSQTLSCKYIEDVCPFCNGTGISPSMA
mmetsp:Transcript_11434/g.19587  ORF Transcript_11434/g.19587 Transcript_11434/m.19587 type:complete len:634 (+) Transcript_11434:330-2231(+)